MSNTSSLFFAAIIVYLPFSLLLILSSSSTINPADAILTGMKFKLFGADLYPTSSSSTTSPQPPPTPAAGGKRSRTTTAALSTPSFWATYCARQAMFNYCPKRCAEHGFCGPIRTNPSRQELDKLRENGNPMVVFRMTPSTTELPTLATKPPKTTPNLWANYDEESVDDDGSTLDDNVEEVEEEKEEVLDDGLKYDRLPVPWPENFPKRNSNKNNANVEDFLESLGLATAKPSRTTPPRGGSTRKHGRRGADGAGNAPGDHDDWTLAYDWSDGESTASAAPVSRKMSSSSLAFLTVTSFLLPLAVLLL